MEGVVVIIPCWRRIEYLEPVLAAIRGQAPVILFPDKDAALPIHRLALKYGCMTQPPPTIHHNASVNILRSLEYGAQLGYDHILQLDSDVIASRNLVRLLLAVEWWMGGNAIVGSSDHYFGDFDSKVRLAGVLVSNFENGGNALYPRRVLKAMAPTLARFREAYTRAQPVRPLFLDLAQMVHPPNRFTRDVLAGRAGTCSDAATYATALATGISVAFLKVNRVKPIGIVGENTSNTGAAWMESVHLDEIPGDECRSDFTLEPLPV